MKHKEKIYNLRKSIKNAKSIGSLKYNCPNWGITIINEDNRISNFIFDCEDFQEVASIIKKHEKKRSKDE